MENRPKDVENRTWNIETGPLAIMAGKSTSWLDQVSPIQRYRLQALLPWEELPYGAILGWVNVVDVQAMNIRLRDNCWAHGPVCWILDRPQKLVTPIPYRGQQGIFHVPDELLRGKEYIGQAQR
jgi:hypothetical protein